mmetsp:Transcript_14809/g.29204  ORF Transcript_14809/g.29204 Transcript_14809/m.29204 type:complete len:130 (-) Transcript_14809:41-430(-)
MKAALASSAFLLLTLKTAALLWTGHETGSKHFPMTPDNLNEYRDEADGCMTWCAAKTGPDCFDGCRDKCSKHLGAPNCPIFKGNTKCMDACLEVKKFYECTRTVSYKNTLDCAILRNGLNLPKEGCKIN